MNGIVLKFSNIKRNRIIFDRNMTQELRHPTLSTQVSSDIFLFPYIYFIYF